MKIENPVLCPTCHQVVGFKSLLKNKIEKLRITIGNTELPTIDLKKEVDLSKPEHIYYFCPWCNYPIDLFKAVQEGEVKTNEVEND